MLKRMSYVSLGVNAPIDQDKFDHRMPLRATDEVFDAIRRTSESYRGTDFGLVLDKLIQLNANQFVEVNGEKVAVEKGQISGRRGTSLINTLVNLSYAYVVRKKTLSRIGIDPIYSVSGVGDDDDISCANYRAAAALISGYNSIGAVINPRKYYISKEKTEFLRKKITTERVVGMPLRSVVAIFFRKPNQEPEFDGELRMNDQLERWLNYMGRGARFNVCWAMMLEDISRATGIKKDDIERWVLTPITLGGGGLTTSDVHLRKTASLGIEKGKKEVAVDVDPTPGIVELQSMWDKKGMIMKRKDVFGLIKISNSDKKRKDGGWRLVEKDVSPLGRKVLDKANWKIAIKREYDLPAWDVIIGRYLRGSKIEILAQLPKFFDFNIDSGS